MEREKLVKTAHKGRPHGWATCQAHTVSPDRLL